MLQGIIFDMDGTMINTEDAHAKASILALKELGLREKPSPERILEVSKKTSGTTNHRTAEIILAEFDLPYTPEELTQRKAQKLMDLYVADENLSLCPGIDSLIHAAKGRYKLAVASSSPIHEIHYITQRFKVASCFDVMVSGDELPFSKPAPDIFLEAARRLGVPPRNCMVFEDSHNGVAAARSAGMFVVGYNNPWTPHYDLSQAHVQIKSYEGLHLEALAQKMEER